MRLATSLSTHWVSLWEDAKQQGMLSICTYRHTIWPIHIKGHTTASLTSANISEQSRAGQKTLRLLSA